MSISNLSSALAVAAFVVLGLCMASQQAAAEDLDNCLQIRPSYDQTCGHPDDVSITYTNVCSRPIQASWCIQRVGLTWDCGSDFAVAPGGTGTSYSCHSTGVIKGVACEKGGNCVVYGRGTELITRR